jgi:hypothetical protein
MVYRLVNLPTTKIHESGSLIDKNLGKLIEDRVRLFEKKKLKTASFSEVVGYLTGYEFVVEKTNAGGYCNYHQKVICLSEANNEREDGWVSPTSGMFFPKDALNKMIVLHEIGHALQAEAEKYIKMERLLSAKLYNEWQAESIAFKLYNSLYGKADHRFFDSYFNDRDVEFLKSWYGDYLQDDSQ